MIDSSAFFVDVILHYQITALAGKCVETIIEAIQTRFFLGCFAGWVERDGFMLDFIKRGTALMVSLERLQPNQPRDGVGVVADVSDLDALVKLSSETIKSFVSVFFGERRSAPLKGPD